MEHPCDKCEAPYGYRNHMSLDKDTHQFAVRIAKIKSIHSLLHTIYIRAYYISILYCIHFTIYIGCCLDVNLALAFINIYLYVCGLCLRFKGISIHFIIFLLLLLFSTRLVYFIYFIYLFALNGWRRVHRFWITNLSLFEILFILIHEWQILDHESMNWTPLT